MSIKFSRRQLLRLGGCSLLGAGASIMSSSSLWAQPIFVDKRPLNQNQKYRRRNRIFKPILKETFYTSGRYLYNPNGSKVTLRGANLPILDDWNFPGSDKLSELEKTGANAVRIQWYKDYGNSSRPAFSIADLDRLLTRCRDYQMIPILYLNDLTCQSDPNMLNSQLIPWWTSDAVVSVLKKHERYLIINLANELGNYRWASNQTIALDSFKNAYKSAIASIRAVGLKMPIAIDAPDCGTSIEVFPIIAQELINHDPIHNIIFSGHAYWSAYNGLPQIQATINANIPLFFGEIANKQDEFISGATQYCYYDMDGTSINHPTQNGFTYQSLLQLLVQQEIGWLAWSWWKDNCTARQMTTDGNFTGLTPFGEDIVNNPIYGLKSTAKRIAL